MKKGDIVQMAPTGAQTKVKMSKKEIPIPIKPEERDIAGMIRVLKANINASRGGPFKPDVVFTKGEMAYIVEILEQHLAQGIEE